MKIGKKAQVMMVLMKECLLLLKEEPSFERSQIKNVTIESNKNKKEREEKMRIKK